MPRLIALDLLRSGALLLMILYHIIFNPWSFYDGTIDPFAWPLLWSARLTAALFLLIVGVSFVISQAKGRPYTYYAWRAAKLLLVAMLISFVTYTINSATFVRFGIVHLIAISIAILPFAYMLELRIRSIVSVICIAIGILLNTQEIGTTLLLPIGVPPVHFASIDYFPILPWFGITLLGTVVANPILSYCQKTDTLLNNRIWKTLSTPGRYSLVIYLIHQPIIMAILWWIKGTPILSY